MKNSFLIWMYCLVLITDLFAVYSGNEMIRYVSKPMLMPLLVVFFSFGTKVFSSSLKKWVILALLFSWAGDVLLMFESESANFFIFGLVAFLTAHVFYIFFFENILRLENLTKNYWLFIPVLAYSVTLIYLLFPGLGEMKVPVLVYGVVISYMLIQALQCGRIKNRDAVLLMIPGACLFIISDSVLAINKFYQQFEYAGITIMMTYGIAQLLLTLGAMKYISSASSHKFAE